MYAPNAKLRPLVVRARTVRPVADTAAQLDVEVAAAEAKPASKRLDWASLQARTFGEDVWRCPCGGRRKVLAVVTSHRTAEELLQRLGLLTPRRVLPPSQCPPQLALAL